MFSKSFLTTAALSLTALSPLQAETYITEKNVQIDRCACAWFITRFLDPEPSFVFIKQGETPPAGVTYDFFGADYFHRGPDCSYTTFVKTHIKQKNPALIEINKIVNDVFAWQSGPNSLSVTIKEHIDLLADLGHSDAQIYDAMLPVFDLLYLSLGGLQKQMLKQAPLNTVEKTILQEVYEESLTLSKEEQQALDRAPLLNNELNTYLAIAPEGGEQTALSLRNITLKILSP